MKKQTAVEWLEMEIVKIENCYPIPHKIYQLCEDAKAIEKEQIITAYLDGADACDLEVKGDRILLVKPDTNLSGQEYFLENF